jgi:hypothetical protein
VKTVLLAVPATDVSANQAPLEPDVKRGASINLLDSFIIKELIFVIGLRLLKKSCKFLKVLQTIRSTLLPNRDQSDTVQQLDNLFPISLTQLLVQSCRDNGIQ